jgi:hypothetical protein
MLFFGFFVGLIKVADIQGDKQFVANFFGNIVAVFSGFIKIDGFFDFINVHFAAGTFRQMVLNLFAGLGVEIATEIFANLFV